MENAGAPYGIGRVSVMHVSGVGTDVTVGAHVRQSSGKNGGGISPPDRVNVSPSPYSHCHEVL